jgi:hypothetical protein
MQHCLSAFAHLRACGATAGRRRDVECCGRKKLPFAEYSVVKDQLGGFAPRTPARSLAGARAPRRSLARVLFATIGRESVYVGWAIGALLISQRALDRCRRR